MHEACGGRFSIKTTALLAIQMIDLMKSLHSRGFIHRDIKPENFCLGQGINSGKVYMIDFGLSKRYMGITDAIMNQKDDFDGESINFSDL